MVMMISGERFRRLTALLRSDISYGGARKELAKEEDEDRC
jgi:hypothetical protein